MSLVYFRDLLKGKREGREEKGRWEKEGREEGSSHEDLEMSC